MPFALNLSSLTTCFRSPDLRLHKAARCVVEQIEARTMMSATLPAEPGIVVPLVQANGPMAPMHLRAQSVSDTSIHLTWIVVPSTADTLILDISTDQKSFTTLSIMDASQTQFTVTNLDAETDYYFALWAMDDYGRSPYAEVAWVQTTNGVVDQPAPQSLPQTPAPLVESEDDDMWTGNPLPPGMTAPAAPSGLAADSSGPTSIDLTWSPADPQAGSLVLDYSTNGQSFITLTQLGAADVSYSLSGLETGSTYWFRLWAMNEAGSSEYSAVVSATAGAIPAPAPSPTPQLPPATLQSSVVGFQILNARTGKVLADLKDGDVVDLAKLGTSRIDIKAVVTGAKPGSVAFNADGMKVIENYAPFELAGNSGYWSPSNGQHTITAVGFAQRFAKGEAGTGLTVNFTVANSQVVGVNNIAEGIRKRAWSL